MSKGIALNKLVSKYQSELNGIPLLPKSAEEYRSDQNALVKHLTEAFGESGEAIGLRGIYKSELGVRDLPRSWDDRDGDRAAGHPTSQLEGTSTIGLTGDWSYDPDAVADNFKRHVDRASWFGDTPYLAVVHGKPPIDDIAADEGEYVLKNARTVAYIRRKPR